MDTCSNCGTQLRSGAKFCTSCGARQNPKPDPSNSGWETQRTEVISTVTPVTEDAEQTLSTSSNDRFRNWGSAYGDSAEFAPSDDPASRFISALERNPIPEPEPIPAPEPEEETPDRTWVTPPPSAFTPPTPTSWSWSAGETEQQAESEQVPEDTEPSDWKAPDSWSNVSEMVDDHLKNQGEPDSEPDDEPLPTATPEPEKDQLEDVTIEEPAEESVVADEPLPVEAAAVTQAPPEETTASPDLSSSDARAHAISLVDELRQMIRLMPSGEARDPGAAAMALTEATLSLDDYGDVRDALAAVRDNPRDIQALSDFAKSADRIEALLKSHQSLVDTIEKAIAELVEG